MPYFIALTILLAPAYAVKFRLFDLPVNILMLWVLIVWTVFGINLILKNQRRDFVILIKKLNKKKLFLIIIFFLTGLASLFWPKPAINKLGQFIVLFLQPISLFFISTFIINKYPNAKRLILNTLYIILAACGLYALIQYFTLYGLPPTYWGNSIEPKRALALFSHPNFYSLFAAPLLACLIPDAFSAISKLTKPLLWLIGAIGLLLSMSRAGWLGLGIAGLVYFFVAADKKVRKLVSVMVIVIVIVIFSVPNFRWRFALPFYGEKSAVSRVSLWNTGWKAVKESPLLGLGLTGFAQNWDRLNVDQGLDRHNFPHNIFLDLWVETGITGLISLMGLIGLMIYRGLNNRADIFKLGASLFLIALITQGFIDNPYFKNDLAMVFWIILSLA